MVHPQVEKLVEEAAGIYERLYNGEEVADAVPVWEADGMLASSLYGIIFCEMARARGDIYTSDRELVSAATAIRRYE